MKYEPTVIAKMASTLDARADMIVALSWSISVILGFISGLVLSSFEPRINSLVCIVAGIVICGFLGWVVLGNKALPLRAEAQKLLCEVEQERHLRFIATQLQNLPKGTEWANHSQPQTELMPVSPS